MRKAVAIYNPKSGLVKKVNKNLKDTITKIFKEYGGKWLQGCRDGGFFAGIDVRSCSGCGF